MLVTLFTAAIWLDALSVAGGFSPFVRWREPGMMLLVSATYIAGYVAMFGLILIDWQGAGLRRKFCQRALWSVFLFSVLVNVAGFLVRTRMPGLVASTDNSVVHPIVYISGDVQDVFSTVVHWLTTSVTEIGTWLAGTWVVQFIGPLFRSIGNWFAEYADRLVCAIVSLAALRMAFRRLLYGMHEQATMNWLGAAVVPWVFRATFASFISPEAGLAYRIMLGVASVVSGIWLAIWIIGAVRKSRRDGVSSVSAAWKLIAVKFLITVVFAGAASIVLLFVLAIVDEGHPRNEAMAFVDAIMLVCILNWVAFSLRRGWKPLALLCGGTAFCMLVFIPQLSGNPLFFPKVVVRNFGLGYLHADSLSLSGQQCATLARYGVHCDKSKDDAITLTHVNIVNRLGSSVQLELMLQAGKAASTEMTDSKNGATQGTNKQGAPLDVQTLTIQDEAAPLAGTVVHHGSMYGCDDLLKARLLDSLSDAKLRAEKHQSLPPDEKVFESLACIRIVVPKEQLISYTRSGARTYEKGYSGYIATPEKSGGSKK